MNESKRFDDELKSRIASIKNQMDKISPEDSARIYLMGYYAALKEAWLIKHGSTKDLKV